jgi:amidohydrolase
MQYEKGYDPTVNHPGTVSVVRKSISSILGEKGLWEIEKPTLGGEDFSFFASKVPSAFLWLGCRPKEIAPEDFPPLHNPRFTPDENCFSIGAAVLAQAAWDLLQKLEGGRCA